MESIQSVIKIFIFYFILSVACFLMVHSIIGYTALRDDVQFLLFKQKYIHNLFWKGAFYIHTFSAIFVLFAGFTQFASQILKNHRKIHRFMGKAYVFNILLINAPVGMIMALYANGGLLGKTAFIVLDILWFFFTYKAFVCAKQKDFIKHKAFMIRSYTLTFSAVTLRAFKIILPYCFVIDADTLYIINSWLGFVLNLLIAEWIIRLRHK